MVKRNQTIWLILLLLVVGSISYWAFSEIIDQQNNKAGKQLYTIDKSGSSPVMDYSVTADKIHNGVDSGIGQTGLTVLGNRTINKEVKRQKADGSIRWTTRQIVLFAPGDGSSDKVQHAIESALHNTGGEILTTQNDTYQGTPVIRIDVGIKDVLGGDALTLVTDKIYLSHKKIEAVTTAPVEGTGRMAFIIDDFGYSNEAIIAYNAISRPLTYSVLPYRPYSTEAATRGVNAGHQVMLHLPMEALSAAENPEPTSITVTMSDQDIQQAVTKAIQAIPGAIGVNNHQGSKATADRRVMKDVLTVIKSDNLFFVDSRTNSQSVAYDMSRQMGLKTGENALFIDNSSDVEAIKNQIRIAMHLSLEHGAVTVIGHARVNTAEAIKEMIPEIEAAGIKLVFESEMVK